MKIVLDGTFGGSTEPEGKLGNEKRIRIESECTYYGVWKKKTHF